MYGINGQLIYSGTAEASERIDLPGFAAGFITITAVNQTTGWMYQAKFIKQ
jgi:hypothetical protein